MWSEISWHSFMITALLTSNQAMRQFHRKFQVSGKLLFRDTSISHHTFQWAQASHGPVTNVVHFPSPLNGIMNARTLLCIKTVFIFFLKCWLPKTYLVDFFISLWPCGGRSCKTNRIVLLSGTLLS